MQRTCDEPTCGKGYEARRPESRFCSPGCRKRNHRRPKPSEEPPQPVVEGARPRSLLVDQVIAELDRAGRLVSVSGVQAVLLASRMEGLMETGAAVAALSKELSRVMGEALDGAAVVVDPVDELRNRRDAKRAI